MLFERNFSWMNYISSAAAYYQRDLKLKKIVQKVRLNHFFLNISSLQLNMATPFNIIFFKSVDFSLSVFQMALFSDFSPPPCIIIIIREKRLLYPLWLNGKCVSSFSHRRSSSSCHLRHLMQISIILM